MDRTEMKAVLLALTAKEAEASFHAMSGEEIEALLREHCAEILSKREGTPPEQIEHARTEDLVAAALAEEGQPCGDCGKLVLWREDWGWFHKAPSSCFLEPRERPQGSFMGWLQRRRPAGS